MTIYVTGLPGSGKSMVARAIAAVLNLEYLSTGDVARDMATSDEHVKSALDGGMLAPPALFDSMINLRIKSGMVVDGYPRYWEQLANAIMRGPAGFLILDVDLDEAYSRLVLRGRQDDHPDLILRRIRDHNNEMTRVTRWLDANAARVPSAVIDANHSLGEVIQHAVRAVNEWKSTFTSSGD